MRNMTQYENHRQPSPFVADAEKLTITFLTMFKVSASVIRCKQAPQTDNCLALGASDKLTEEILSAVISITAG
jgi:hypothetical protein